MERRRVITAYGLMWLAIVLVIGLGAWLILTRIPFETLEPGELETSSADVTDAPSPSIDENLGATDLTLEGAELSVQSEDGELRMRVIAEAGSKRGGVYTIKEGALLFTMQNKDTLLLRLNNASYSREAGIVRVRGTLTGFIAEGGQYFRASELSWDEKGHQVTTEEVRYVGSSFEVTGEQMSVDLESGRVRFKGKVEFGV